MARDYYVDVLDATGRIIGSKHRDQINKTQDITHGVCLLMVTPRAELVLSYVSERSEEPGLFIRHLGATSTTLRRTNETAEQAVIRELAEELMVPTASPILLGDRWMKPNRGLQQYITSFYTIAEPASYSTLDTENLKVVHSSIFRELIRRNPEHFAPTLWVVWRYFGDRLPL